MTSELLRLALRTCRWGVVLSLPIFNVALANSTDTQAVTASKPNGPSFPVVKAIAKLISTEKISTKPTVKNLSSWHVSQDPEMAKGDPYTGMTCLFKGKQKVYCPENGVGSFSISDTRKRIVAWGGGGFHVPDQGKKIITVLDMDGNVLKEMTLEGAYSLRGHESPNKDALVAAYQTNTSTETGLGVVHLRRFDYNGETKWHKNFPETSLGDFSFTSDGRFYILVLGSPYRGGRTLIVSDAGKVLKEYPAARSVRIGPNDLWSYLLFKDSMIVHDFKSNTRVLTGVVMGDRRRRRWLAGSTFRGDKLIVLENSVEDPQKGTKSLVDMVHIIDKTKNRILRSSIGPFDVHAFKSAKIGNGGRLLLTFGPDEYVFELEVE